VTLCLQSTHELSVTVAGLALGLSAVCPSRVLSGLVVVRCSGQLAQHKNSSPSPPARLEAQLGRTVMTILVMICADGRAARTRLHCLWFSPHTPQRAPLLAHSWPSEHYAPLGDVPLADARPSVQVVQPELTLGIRRTALHSNLCGKAVDSVSDIFRRFPSPLGLMHREYALAWARRLFKTEFHALVPLVLVAFGHR
jgi:hypothetical protein